MHKRRRKKSFTIQFKEREASPCSHKLKDNLTTESWSSFRVQRKTHGSEQSSSVSPNQSDDPKNMLSVTATRTLSRGLDVIKTISGLTDRKQVRSRTDCLLTVRQGGMKGSIWTPWIICDVLQYSLVLGGLQE